MEDIDVELQRVLGDDAATIVVANLQSLHTLECIQNANNNDELLVLLESVDSIYQYQCLLRLQESFRLTNSVDRRRELNVITRVVQTPCEHTALLIMMLLLEFGSMF
jgi:hypothetical protein